MPTVWIDNKRIEVEAGTTVLEAARLLGIDIPTLCYWQGHPPVTSCLVCLVQIEGEERLVPSCSFPVQEGLRIRSEVAEVHEARRTALELLLSDHAGDCLAPCHRICPLELNIPRMLRQVRDGDLEGAVETIREAIALPSIFGRVCHHPCEGGCRRALHDGAVTIQQIERYLGDLSLTDDCSYHPPRQPTSGRRVAIIGTGPAGLTAAYHLLRMGHTCVLYEQHDRIGGSFRTRFSPAELPDEIVRAEVDSLRRLGAQFVIGKRLGGDLDLRTLKGENDAVLLATGRGSVALAQAVGIESGERGIVANPQSCATTVEGVFAAGEAVRGEALPVRAAADGKKAAIAIDAMLNGKPAESRDREFSSVLGRLTKLELNRMLEGQSPQARVVWDKGEGRISEDELRAQAERCLHCDCRKVDTCRLRYYAQKYGANPRAFPTERKEFWRDADHPLVFYESGKCIACGRCASICAEAGVPLGVTHIGRGFEVRIGVPFGESLKTALRGVADECVEACPTGALSRKDERIKSPPAGCSSSGDASGTN